MIHHTHSVSRSNTTLHEIDGVDFVVVTRIAKKEDEEGQLAVLLLLFYLWLGPVNCSDATVGECKNFSVINESPSVLCLVLLSQLPDAKTLEMSIREEEIWLIELKDDATTYTRI